MLEQIAALLALLNDVQLGALLTYCEKLAESCDNPPPA